MYQIQKMGVGGRKERVTDLVGQSVGAVIVPF
jgi:hypothetical protein